MIRLIMEKELREVIGSMKFALTFGMCSLLIVLSFYVGAKNYVLWTRQYDSSKREMLRQLEGLTDWYSVQQNRIFLPPQPLAALVSGISNDIGRTTEVHGRGELTTDDSRFNEDPILAVFRFLDLDFVFQIVLSLFAILFAYDAISGERERGTLKLSLANALPKEQYILGKLFGSLLAVGVPLLIPLLLGCMLLPMMGVPMSSDDWVRLSIIIVTGLLYLGVFISLSVLVSSLTRHSSSTFLMLVVIWIAAVLIVPRSAVLLAGRAVEVPSVDEIASQKIRFSAQLWNEDRKKLSSFNANQPNTPPQTIMEEFNKLMQQIADERDKKMQEFAGHLNEDRENRQRTQQRLALGLAQLSPAASLNLALSEFAGTSLRLEHDYRDAALQYQKEFAHFLQEKNGMVSGGRMIMMRSVVNSDKKPVPINPHDLPEFTYTRASVGQVFGDGLIASGLLILFNIIFFFGSYVAFMKYDVR